jgi:hypothetical protein
LAPDTQPFLSFLTNDLDLGEGVCSVSNFDSVDAGSLLFTHHVVSYDAQRGRIFISDWR